MNEKNHLNENLYCIVFQFHINLFNGSFLISITLFLKNTFIIANKIANRMF